MRRFHWSWLPVGLMVAMLLAGVALMVWEAIA
jgi:hypothetical protein